MKFDKTSLALLTAAVALSGLIYWWQRSAPSGVPGVPLVAVMVPSLSAEATEGERLYNTNCATCHNKNAGGQQGVAPPLVHKIYEPNHHGDESFQRAAKNGVRAHHWPFGNMAPVPNIKREEVAKIITYVRELQRANGIN